MKVPQLFDYKSGVKNLFILLGPGRRPTCGSTLCVWVSSPWYVIVADIPFSVSNGEAALIQVLLECV